MAALLIHQQRKFRKFQEGLNKSIVPNNPIAGKAAHLPADTSFNLELLRLRAEVTALRAELRNNTNSSAALVPAESAASLKSDQSFDSEQIRQILTYDTLKDAGLRQPSQAIETWLWIQRELRDTNSLNWINDRYQEMVLVSPGKKWGGFSPLVIGQDPLQDAKLARVEAIHHPSPDTALVTINFYNDDGFFRGVTHRLAKDGDDWKFDMRRPDE